MTNKILIVDDIELNIDILVSLFAGKYEFFTATEGKNAIKIAKNENIDLILLDIMMPEMDGYEVCKILKKYEKTKNIPIIFLTAKDDEVSIEKAYEVGGVDYVKKPFKPIEIIKRIENQLKINKLIDELKEKNKKLEQLTLKDALTDIYNRRGFELIASKLIALSKREKKKISLLMIDIDFFKKINDTYGHLIGDIVLKSLVEKVNLIIRQSDVFSRFGGEEFIILLPNTSLKEAEKIGEIIRKNVENMEIKIPGKNIKFTISIGISELKDDLFYAIKTADIALYEAKENGRNRVIVYNM